jgi:voltage-gated potassium channel
MNSDLDRSSRFDRFARIVEWPMSILALAIVPALIVESRAESPAAVTAAVTVNWIIWIAFCAEYLVKLLLASNRRAFVQTAWIDLVIIVLSPPFLVPDAFQHARALWIIRMVHPLRLVRALAVGSMGLRLLRRLLRHRQFERVLIVALGVVGFGAAGIYFVEDGVNPNISSVGDAVWLAVVTATTVGYGDVSPVTPTGRVIAVVLMVTGIGVIGVFTGTVANFFFERSPADTAALEARLERLEHKVDRLLDRSSTGTGERP